MEWHQQLFRVSLSFSPAISTNRRTWTGPQEAAASGLNFGKKVAWPTSTAVTNAGLIDAFRELRPDEVADRGETWTPGYAKSRHGRGPRSDRFRLLHRPEQPTTVLTLGYDGNDSNTDIGIQPYPSDHRSVVVEFDVPGCTVAGDLNGDCLFNLSDWAKFRGGQHADLAGRSHSQAYLMGDLNGDFRNDHADFALFKAAFESTNGAGSFAAIVIGVPEPAFVH